MKENLCKRCGKPFEPEWLPGLKKFSTVCEVCLCRNLFDGLGLPTPPDMLDAHTLKPTLTHQEYKREISKKDNGMNMLAFDELRHMNVKRCEQVFHPLNAWSPTDWACAMAGEAGEACNAVKKLRRLLDGTNTAKDPQTEEDHKKSIAKEIADLVIYADLLAARLEIDLGQAVCDKFNEVSERMGSTFRL